MLRSSPFLPVAALLAGCATTEPAGTIALANHAHASPPGSDSLNETPVDFADVTIKPVAVRQVPPVYPADLRQAGVKGVAVVDFVVGTDGRVHRASVIRATDPRLGAAARAAVEQWQFEPGKIHGRRVNTHLQVPIVFDVNEDKVPSGAAEHHRNPPAQPVFTVDQVSVPPVATFQSPPTFPDSLRARGVSGDALIEFVVVMDGTVADAKVVHATEPEFGVAARACVENWRFTPARRDGVAVNCRLKVPIVFAINR